MADIQLTAAQQAVVNDRGGALLVSAAAGSGKTKVLVDRLLTRICDTMEPCNIDEFLVITYTTAAAAELRQKISDSLAERLAKEPNNRHLRRQLNRIYLAEISTVHSFCANLLRSYAHMLDIPPDFRIAEEAESGALKGKVLQDLLEAGYREHTVSFLNMVELFGYGRDDRRLQDAVFMAHDAMRCRPDMEKWVEQTVAALDISQYSDVSQTPWGEYIMREFHLFLQQQIGRLQQGLEEMSRYPEISCKYGPVFEQNIRQLEELDSCTNWDDLVGKQVVSFGKLNPVRKAEDVQVKDRVAKIRAKCWSDLQKWQQLFYASSEDLLADLSHVTAGSRSLIQFVKEFEDVYGAEKRKRKLMDFSDLEHYAIRLLTDRYSGAPTKLASQISQRYREIMVDEYQDSNQVQEVIFEAISRDGQNRFMVGDVKQSIYRFRLADPGLFLRKYDTYPDYRMAERGKPRKILLSENFRSRPEVLDACNEVFRLIMRRQVGDLEYTDAEALIPGRDFPPAAQTPVELHCLTGGPETEKTEKRDLEAEFVARRIRRLLDEKTMISDGDTSRAIRPGDIVILMRSISNNAPTYLDALRKNGIPAVCNRNGSLLDCTEIQVLESFLQIIDNPHQDVPLLAVLASPLFGFTPDELAEPRIQNRKEDYYDSLQKIDGVFHPFLKLLGELRAEAVWLPLHELIDTIFQQTNMLAVFSAMADGIQRRKNLMSFRAAAVSFESSGSRSLAEFLWYLGELRQSGSQLPIPQIAEEDAVRIMSVHKSKGLEFPVVILSDLSRQFNMKDLREAVLVDEELAVGCNFVDNDRFVRYPTLAKKSIEHKKRREMISEELRILYVAMTRAKDMLIMTYYSKRLLKELETLNSQLTMPLSDELCASVNNPGKWILMAALCRTEAGELLNLVGGNSVSRVSTIPWSVQYHDLSQRQPMYAPPMHIFEKEPSAWNKYKIDLLQYQYPYLGSSAIPAKLTATQLKGRMQDREAADGAVELSHNSAFRFRKPSFLPRELTPAEKGAATHLFLQFAAYEKCTTEEGVEEELHRLCMQEFLTQEQADAVRIDSILSFFTSDFGQWLLTRTEIKREFKFSLLVDANRYFDDIDKERIMLQGVVDCFIPEEDGITILDFKTDRIDHDLEKRAAYYRPQMEAYAEALSRIYQLPIKRKLLHFFAVGETVDLEKIL